MSNNHASPEKARLSIGFLPLIDAAPLIVAKELGIFASEGLEVSLVSQPSWARLRDKLASGQVDAAHLLGPMPMAMTVGLSGPRTETITAVAMSAGGNAITLSANLWARMADLDPLVMSEHPLTARALKAVIEEGKAENHAPLRLATVFPYSGHSLELRYWLSDAGIDPDRDLELLVVPPQLMVDAVKSGQIDGFCAGEPWSSQAVDAGVGRVAIVSSQIWPHRIEKVLGVTNAFADACPNSHQALIRSVILAAQWCDALHHRDQLVELLSLPQYVGVPPNLLRRSMHGRFKFGPDQNPVPVAHFRQFYEQMANFPWISQAAWQISQMVRWGWLDANVPILDLARRCYKPELYALAAQSLNLPLPEHDSKIEGQFEQDWVLATSHGGLAMSSDASFDRRPFDPHHIDRYLAGFAIGRRTPNFSATSLGQGAK